MKAKKYKTENISETYYSDNLKRRYLKGLKCHFLSREKEREIFIEYKSLLHEALNEQDNEKKEEKLAKAMIKRNELIIAHTPFITTIAISYANWWGTYSDTEIEDLINEGIIGFIDSLRKYDPDKGTKLITYAADYIRKHIRNAVRNKYGIHVPSHAQKILKQIEHTKKALRTELEREPTLEEIASKLSFSEKRLERYTNTARLISLETKRGDRHHLSSYIQDRQSPNPFKIVAEKEDAEYKRKRIADALIRLTSRERTVITYRYGINCKPHTLKETGKRLKISSERVRQIEKKALEKLRRYLKINI